VPLPLEPDPGDATDSQYPGDAHGRIILHYNLKALTRGRTDQAALLEGIYGLDFFSRGKTPASNRALLTSVTLACRNNNV